MTKKVPEFRRDADEAAFWDTHDLTEFLGDLETDSETIFVRPEVGVIELSGETWLEIARLARRKRTTPARLVQKWVREKLPHAK